MAGYKEFLLKYQYCKIEFSYCLCCLSYDVINGCDLLGLILNATTFCNPFLFTLYCINMTFKTGMYF